jgi:hypothetical protein
LLGNSTLARVWLGVRDGIRSWLVTVEALIVEAQILCGRPLERHAVGAEPLRRRLQHHRVHVGGYDLRLRYRPVQRPCQDAGAGGGLKNGLRLEEDRAVGQNLRIGLERRVIAGWNLLYVEHEMKTFTTSRGTVVPARIGAASRCMGVAYIPTVKEFPFIRARV